MDERNRFEQNEEIDLVDFSSNRETDRIRENERIEREKRRKRAAEIRRQEIIKRKKRERLMQMISAWGLVLIVTAGVVASIVGIVSLFNKEDKPDTPDVGDMVSDQEKAAVDAFKADKNTVYVKEGTNPYEKLAKEVVIKTSSEENLISDNGFLYMYSEAYAWNSGLGNKDNLKNVIRDTPILKNGYIWSTPSAMKSDMSQTYHYDTHASFIKAVCEICLWEGDTSFLGMVDEKSANEKDASGGMSVGQKLNHAVDYYFDKTPNAGGIRYNEEDGLVYILQAGNDGKPSSNASNVFFTYSFGNLDCYNNLLFYDAMVSLSKLYEMAGNSEKSEYYSGIAQKNKQAINDTFYDSSSGRYIGYKDVDGNEHDYGFTVVNLMAVKLGVAEGDKAEKIMSWVDSDAKASTGVLPEFTTVKADDSGWITYGKYLLSTNASYRSFWLNGGRSAISGYYYLGAKSTLDKKAEMEYLAKVAKSVQDGTVGLAETSDEFSEPVLHYALYGSDVIKKLFGVSTDGNVLTVSPCFDHGKNMGIKNISFRRRNYDVLFDNGSVYMFCDVAANTKVKIGGFEKDCKLTLTVVDNGKIVSTEEIKADKNGNAVIAKSFGDTSYVKLSKTEQKQ